MSKSEEVALHNLVAANIQKRVRGGRIPGKKNYDNESLLKLVNEVCPVNLDDWAIVSQLYFAEHNTEAEPRRPDVMRKHFVDLARKGAIRTGFPEDDIHLRAVKIYNEIHKTKKAKASNSMSSSTRKVSEVQHDKSSEEYEEQEEQTNSAEEDEDEDEEEEEGDEGKDDGSHLSIHKIPMVVTRSQLSQHSAIPDQPKIVSGSDKHSHSASSKARGTNSPITLVSAANSRVSNLKPSPAVTGAVGSDSRKRKAETLTLNSTEKPKHYPVAASSSSVNKRKSIEKTVTEEDSKTKALHMILQMIMQQNTETQKHQQQQQALQVQMYQLNQQMYQMNQDFNLRQQEFQQKQTNDRNELIMRVMELMVSNGESFKRIAHEKEYEGEEDL